MSNLNTTLTLSAAALAYLRQGQRPIPIREDKTPAVPWGDFRVRPPARLDLRAWFVEQQHPAIGLITGQPTGLVVLDFDQPALYDTFRQQHPDLARTFTVATPRGVHLWFHLPPRRQLPSRRAAGVDLLSDGRYAIAPPSRVHSGSYAVTDDTPPRFLDLPSIAAINAFLDNPRQQATPPAPAPSAPVAPTAPRFAAEDLQRLYGQHVMASGRNNALFAAACLARDRGWSALAVSAALADLHASQPAPPGHARESFARRLREADRTIASVYTRPARAVAAARRVAARQLPNSVREALVVRGQTHTVRVIEGLRQRGIAPGQAFSYSQARALLAGLVGDWSVRAALHAATAAGAPLIARAGGQGGACAVDVSSDTNQEKCVLEPLRDQRKIGRGRPPILYTMPSNAELCALLGVTATFSDPLTPADLSSARQTRLALHRELIRRRPGPYPRGWLARRLGLSVATIDRYNRLIPIQSRPTYAVVPIFWSTLGFIPDDDGFDDARRGSFLEDETGKRYPPLRAIARRLLKRRRRVVYKVRGVNEYWCEDLQAPAPAPAVARPQPAQPAPTLTPALPGFDLPPRRPDPPALTRTQQRALDRQRQQAVKDMANTVYDTIQRLAESRAQRISRANARQLVETYGLRAVERALEQLRRYPPERIASPVGWLIAAAQREYGPRPPRFCGVQRPRRQPAPGDER